MATMQETRKRMIFLMREGWEQDKELSKEIQRLGSVLWDGTAFKEPLETFSVEDLTIEKLIKLKQQRYTNKEIIKASGQSATTFFSGLNVLKEYHGIPEKKRINESLDINDYEDADLTVREAREKLKIKNESRK